MDNINFTAGREGLDFASSVEALIKNSCIVDYGIIQKVTSKGLVEVSLAVSQTEQSMVIMTCVLANIASSSFTLDVIPNVGDRVLVVYPRIYDEDMFDVPDSDSDKTKIIVNKRAKGYNLTTGIAILLNQCKTACHKNVIKFENGAITIKNEKTEVTLESSGAVIAKVGYDSTAEKYAGTAQIASDGYLSYSHKDGKTQLTFTSSTMSMQDAQGCKIESTTNGVDGNKGIIINGKLKIKG